MIRSRCARLDLEVELLLRIERRQVVEEDLVLRRPPALEVDRLDAQQREVALASLGGRTWPETVSPVLRSNA
jgi:hypothetical protein